MEKYLEVTTITQRPLANRVSEALERAGIPLMVERVEVAQGSDKRPGFRLLVPGRHSRTASVLASAANAALPVM